MPWLSMGYDIRRLAHDCFTQLEIIAFFAAVACWYSIALTEAALQLGEIRRLKRPHT